MADRRIELHEILCGILGSRNVYFQPPPSVQMKYDAIVYSLSGIQTGRADDRNYISRKRYTVTIISRDPDSELPDKLIFSEELPYTEFDRYYTADNLNHWAFTLYF